MKFLRSLLCLLVVIFTSHQFLAADTVNVAWVRHYDGPAGGDDDVAKDLAIDTAGNVYVTGNGMTNSSDRDYGTIKYSPNGDSLWAKRYDGISGSSDFDGANAVTVNDSGYVYVTGTSDSESGSSANYAYATIKYKPNGDTAWVRRYEGTGNNEEARDVAVDGSGNVYVTGQSGNDYLTIKYSPNGDTNPGQGWVRRESDHGTAKAVAVDGSGNVYVTGSSGTIKYSPTGGKQWDSTGVNGNALAIDASGSVYVTGSAGSDFKTIKYTATGGLVWSKTYDGPGLGGDDIANDLKVDNNGNVYVTGVSDNSGNNDYATIKYSPSGDTSSPNGWVRRYKGPANGNDIAKSLAIDADGNVYVTGLSEECIGNYSDYATIKYSPSGDTTGIGWVRRYNRGLNYNDEVERIIVDPDENVYVTGTTFHGYPPGEDYTTIKYSPSSCSIKPGDANSDGNVTGDDITFLVNYIYRGGPPPSPYCRGDVNASGCVNNVDIVYLNNHLFHGGPAPIKSQECCL